MSHPDMRARARSLRRNQTDAEQRLWFRLRSRRLAGYKFRRQVWIGHYIADFVCESRQLIVEIDGSQHAAQEEYDGRRSERLKERGYRVVRVWNNDVVFEIEAVLERILEELRR